MKKFIIGIFLGAIIASAVIICNYDINKDPDIARLEALPVLKLYVITDEVSNTKCTIYSFKSIKEVTEAIYSVSSEDCYLTVQTYYPPRIPIKKP